MSASRVSQLVRRFGQFKPQKGGSELVFICPECLKRKLSYNVARNTFHPCWSCTFTVRLKRKVKRFIKSFEPGKKVAEDAEVPCPQLNYTFTQKAVEFLETRGIGHVPEGWGQMDDGRIYIPIFENGRIMSWVARDPKGGKFKEISGPNRSHFFYGYDGLRDIPVFNGGNSIILVEGIFDQIHITSLNQNCLALMGSSISDIQIGKLMALKPNQVILMLDGDDAGRKATETIAKKLGARMNPMSIRKVWLPEGRDPDTLTREEFDGLLK